MDVYITGVIRRQLVTFVVRCHLVVILQPSWLGLLLLFLIRGGDYEDAQTHWS